MIITATTRVAPFYPGLKWALEEYRQDFCSMAINPADCLEKYQLLTTRLNGVKAPHYIFLIQRPDLGLASFVTSATTELNERVYSSLERHLRTRFYQASKEVLKRVETTRALSVAFFIEAANGGFDLAISRLKSFRDVSRN